jgi:tRNA pseudouridine32 synthase/23S rRNA pseudouridine746 synthase
MCIEIIYQDEYLIAVNKPFGLLSVPGRGEDKQDCVVSRLQQRCDDVRVVHRLDCHTSGVMLLARGADMQRRLSRLFHDRQIDKRYIAVVEGAVQPNEGVIDIPLRGDPDNRPVQVVDYVNGKPARTHWRLLRHLDGVSGSPTSRLVLYPVTGRTHQLRVHCMALGHPIVGDRLYNSAGDCARRMMLHADRLGLIHPVTNERLCLAAGSGF